MPDTQRLPRPSAVTKHYALVEITLEGPSAAIEARQDEAEAFVDSLLHREEAERHDGAPDGHMSEDALDYFVSHRVMQLPMDYPTKQASINKMLVALRRALAVPFCLDEVPEQNGG